MRLILSLACSILVAACGLVPTLIVINAQAGDAAKEWRQWGGPSRDFISNATGLADSWPVGGPPELWSRPLGAGHAAYWDLCWRDWPQKAMGISF